MMSEIFIVIFMQVITITLYVNTNFIYRLKTVEYCRHLSRLSYQERIVFQYLQKHLSKLDEIEQEVVIDRVIFSCVSNQNLVEITITQPILETIVVNVQDEEIQSYQII